MKLLVGTKKGAFTLASDASRARWELGQPIFFGHIVNHFVSDPRQPDVMLIAAKTGHLGPTVYRSLDSGKTWKEAGSPPAFRTVHGSEAEVKPATDGAVGKRAVDRVFWLTPGHKSERGVWYAGTSPAGLFRSEDQGETWASVDGFNENPSYKDWASMPTPDGQFLHSINIDPRNARQMYLSISVGGTFESADQGQTWRPLNRGVAADFMPDPNVDFGHDPHCMVVHPSQPDRLYQQNHCGIYRLDKPGAEWTRIGKNMPAEIGDIGFPIVVHPGNPDCAWVFPMDGTEVWPRTSPGGKPCVYMTKDAGSSWSRLDRGLPDSNAYFTVKRQSMTADHADPVGLYFGTTSGEIWASRDEGASWSCIAQHLPEVYSLAVQP